MFRWVMFVDVSRGVFTQRNSLGVETHLNITAVDTLAMESEASQEAKSTDNSLFEHHLIQLGRR